MKRMRNPAILIPRTTLHELSAWCHRWFPSQLGRQGRSLESLDPSKMRTWAQRHGLGKPKQNMQTLSGATDAAGSWYHRGSPCVLMLKIRYYCVFNKNRKKKQAKVAIKSMLLMFFNTLYSKPLRRSKWCTAPALPAGPSFGSWVVCYGKSECSTGLCRVHVTCTYTIASSILELPVATL